ncbi:hypothetical protein DFR50_102174 [Roseiarcus fermentans]|uniref:Uncharacterized protein n=1 Tax=Roseiarcus fermentans TaxID=1473586 RepID=A0A366FSP0_9HYPH|nr:hypothetical protein [Roseiarcus fermentans]RBP17682.1 hypothetical protein DFR50_102174 [Roseiarcus fermentans]
MQTPYRHRTHVAALALALGFAAVSPALAQFFAPGGFPVIAVPPPAQNLVMPRKPKPAPPPVSPPPTDPLSQPQIVCTYHGQTRVCQ